MGNCCSYKEFIKELDYCKSEMTVWGTNYHIMQTVWNIQRKVKEFYPPNGIPQHIMDSMHLMEERMKIANEQLAITCEQAEEAVKIAEHVNREKFYQNLYDESQVRIKKLEKDILSLEQLIKDLMTDEKKKQARIQRENDELHRARQIQALSQDPVVIKAIQDFHGMDRISRPMTEEEKDGAFNQLLKMKKDYPDILPSVEQMIKEHKNDTST